MIIKLTFITFYYINNLNSINQKIRMEDKFKSGSPFLFVLIRFFNIGLGLTAITLFCLAIWLWVQLNQFSVVEVGFMLLGIFQLLLVMLVFSAKKSPVRLKIFFFLMCILFVIELTGMIIVFVLGDSIIDKVVNKADALDEYNKLKGYLFLVNYFVIGTLVIELMLILLVKCYIGSIRSRNGQYDYKFIDAEGRKITIEQKQRDDEVKIRQKYSKRKQEMNQKYGRNR